MGGQLFARDYVVETRVEGWYSCLVFSTPSGMLQAASARRHSGGMDYRRPDCQPGFSACAGLALVRRSHEAGRAI
eukprot:11080736-Lingulodinium_polyedra.AAC.1